MMEVTHVDTRLESVLAHRAVFKHIVRDTPEIAGLAEHPRQFFINAMRPIKGYVRSNRRVMGIEALIAWVRWGDITRRALATRPHPQAKKRIMKSSTCTPGCIGVRAKFYWKCENYLCPMCWYRHVRDRVAHMSEYIKTITMDSVLRIEGVTKEEFEKVPDRDAHRLVYREATILRRAISPAGALTAVRLRGHPGRWVLSAEILCTGAGRAAISGLVKDAFSKPDNLDWMVYSVMPGDPDKLVEERKRSRSNGKRKPTADKRGDMFLKTVANCLQYPVGVYHKKFTAKDLELLFSGTQLSRSRLTGDFSS